MKNRILLEYSLLSLIVTTGIALVVSHVIVSQSQHYTMNQHTSFLVEYLDSIPANYPELADALDKGHEPDEHDVDHFLRDLFLFPSIVQIRIRRPNGDLLWETVRHDVTYDFLWSDTLPEILSGGLQVRIIDGVDSHPILSVIYPVQMNGRALAIVEAIDVDQYVHGQLELIRRQVATAIALSGAAFYLLLFFLFYVSYLRLRRSNTQLEKSQEVTIRTMSRLAELRDNETGAHIDRTSHYCEILASELMKTKQYSGYISKDYIADLKRSAPLHDIGKVGIPDSILNKPGPLSEEEWSLMRQHPKMGAEVLIPAIEELEFHSYFELGLQVVLSHHENWDGTGYPDGLSGDRIPLSARIMALADVYDALRTTRPYKTSMTHESAVRIIQDDRGRKFDPDIVDAFLASQELFLEISETR